MNKGMRMISKPICNCGHSEAYHNQEVNGRTGCMLCFKLNLKRPYSVSKPVHDFEPLASSWKGLDNLLD